VTVDIKDPAPKKQNSSTRTPLSIKVLSSMIGLNFILLSTWLGVSPYAWDAQTTQCSSQLATEFLAPLVLLKFSVLCMGFYQAVRSPHWSTPFNESMHLVRALGAVACIGVMGVIVLLLTGLLPFGPEYLSAAIPATLIVISASFLGCAMGPRWHALIRGRRGKAPPEDIGTSPAAVLDFNGRPRRRSPQSTPQPKSASKVCFRDLFGDLFTVL
jgi:hypothetical protein